MSGPEDHAGGFEASRECFAEALSWLAACDVAALSRAELEDQLDCRGRELLRRMFQDHLGLRAATEHRLDAVLDAEAVAHAAVETGHRRLLSRSSVRLSWSVWPTVIAATRTCFPQTRC